MCFNSLHTIIQNPGNKGTLILHVKYVMCLLYMLVFLPSMVLTASKSNQQIVFCELEDRGVLMYMYMDVCNCIFPLVYTMYMYNEV